MKKFAKEIRASISLFLSMIILLLVILEGFLIDGSKVLASKVVMSGAGELALNAGLTYYDEALRDIYGLFAVSKTEGELTENLKIHFQKTLGETVGRADGEYVDSLLAEVDKIIRLGWEGQDAGRLLDLNLDTNSFLAQGVDQSALSEPYVMKSQVLEYMKYRGPASIGYGMLEKLHSFKELDKQQKVMEDKLEYEEKMSDVQKACKDAYENIVPYNDLLNGKLKPETVEENSKEINKYIRDSIVAIWCYSAVKRDYGVDANWEVETSTTDYDVEDAISRCIYRDEMVELFEFATEQLNQDNRESMTKGAMSSIKIAIGYSNEYDNYRHVYTTWKNYKIYNKEETDRLEEELADLEEDDDGEAIEAAIKDLAEELEDLGNLYAEMEADIQKFAGILNIAKGALNTYIEDKMQKAVSDIDELSKDASRLIQLAEYGNDALDKVLAAMIALEELGNDWDSSINELSAGDIKTSMTLDHKSKAEMLDVEKINDLKERLAYGIVYGQELDTAAKKTMVISYNPCGNAMSNYAEKLRERLEESIYGNDTLANSSMHYDSFKVDFWTENAMETAIQSDEKYTNYLVNEAGAKFDRDNVRMDLAIYKTDMDKISAGNDDFFKYLERICPESEAERESRDKAKETQEKMLESSNKQFEELERVLPDLSVNVTGASGGSGEKFTKTPGTTSDKKVSENAKNNSKGTANLLGSVEGLLLKGRDKLYITEYATQMFSYYTIDKMKDSDQLTLSGYPINPLNNQMYGAELEYILWGDPSGEKDVQYTISTIFGIRFLLNSLYAFTGDAEIRQVSLALAVSIAGWTGFGVPLVQSVTILAFALAETLLDIETLKDGKNVPIYKSTTTWCTKPSGISNQEIIDAVTTSVNEGKKRIMDSLNQLTEETAGKFKAELTSYTNSVISDIAKGAAATIFNPLQELLLSLVNVINPSEEHIREKVDELFQEMESVIATEEKTIQRMAKEMALSYMKQMYQNELINTIKSIQNSEKTNIEKIERVYEFFSNAESELIKYLKGIVEPEVNKLSDEVENALNSGSEQIQKKTSEALDKMLIRINCGISFTDREATAKDVNGANGRTATSSALTMNYKEYLWLLIAVKSVENEDEILKRMGNLIQANLAASKTLPSAGFQITSAYTFIEIDATADLSTTFFSVPIPVSGGQGVTLGQDKYSIGYRGVLGY